MAERPIVLYGDPVLREVSEPVEEINQEVKDLVSDLVDTIKKAKGLGLAAVQIGVLKRVFIVDLSATEYVDSSALGMMLLLKEFAESGGSSVRIRTPRPEVREILTIASFDKIFKFE